MRSTFKEGGHPLPFQTLHPLGAGVLPMQGNLLQLVSGYGQLVSGSVPNGISLGPADRDAVDAGVAASDGKMLTWNTFVSGYVASTSSNDGFAATDMGVVAWGKDYQTPGKLSNLAGSNRSMLGLVFGLDYEINRTPLMWVGPVAHCVARSVHAVDNYVFGAHNYAVDAGAATDLTETQFNIPRAKVHGLITGIEFIANATLAADATNYKTLTVTKYAADGTTPVVVGTMTTVLVTTKWVAKAFTLSAVAGALNILEGDTFTIQNSHAASGAVTPAGQIRITGKVQ